MSDLEPFEFPKLTVLPDSEGPPQQPRLTNFQKYGGLYWLGIAGLVSSLLLVGWFAVNMWLMRDVWREIYVLHNEDLPEARRIAAAEFLANAPDIEATQIQPMIFRRPLPEKARIILAESLKQADNAASARQMLGLLATEGATSPQPWLRRHLARLAAITIPVDSRFPANTFEKHLSDDDAVVADWSAFALTRQNDPLLRKKGVDWLESRSGDDTKLAEALLAAVRGVDLSRSLALEQATRLTSRQQEATPEKSGLQSN